MGDDPAIREPVRATLRGEDGQGVGPILTDAPTASVVAGGDHRADLDRLRAAAADTPTVIFSAQQPSAFAGYAECGFAGFIAKPFDVEALVATVRDALTRQPVAAERG